MIEIGPTLAVALVASVGIVMIWVGVIAFLWFLKKGKRGA